MRGFRESIYDPTVYGILMYISTNVEPSVAKTRVTFYFFYLPMQKSLNITSKISSEVIFPVIFPISLVPLRMLCAANTTSSKSI